MNLANPKLSVVDALPSRCQRFTAALARGDSESASQIIEDLLKTETSLPEIYLEIIGPALVSIGDCWRTGEIGVGDEHLATQIVDAADGSVALIVHRPGATLALSCAGRLHRGRTAFCRRSDDR